ncbi:unnamed protein product [Musa acuminata subsp. malaccensis]|uniref:(wild Malaysian banana) hypothetical protein n=1 Tax=Musa acuminata subsp. malaccensis TaxID=214687 RepID=A0A804HTC3_MUSAM|nr:unnamed protein product [Musa acuminata subsp. malaccensis]
MNQFSTTNAKETAQSVLEPVRRAQPPAAVVSATAPTCSRPSTPPSKTASTSSPSLSEAAPGNSGPFLLGVVNNAAPWVITVAASTIDRDFKQTITSTNNKQIQGRSFTLKSLDTGKKYTLIRAVDAIAANASKDDATLCDPHSIDAAKVEGKIVLCQRGPPPPVLDNFPQASGAAGTIVIDNNKRGDNFLMTAFMDQAHLLISEKDGQAL